MSLWGLVLSVGDTTLHVSSIGTIVLISFSIFGISNKTDGGIKLCICWVGLYRCCFFPWYLLTSCFKNNSITGLILPASLSDNRFLFRVIRRIHPEFINEGGNWLRRFE